MQTALNNLRIVIIAPGSRGDVQPYIALGKGLKQTGNSVCIVTHQNFQALAASHGLEFWPIEGDLQEIVQSQAMRTRIERGNFLSLMAQMAREARRGALRMAEAGLAASKGADMLLAGMGGVYIGLAVAEKLGLPLLQAYLVPFTPTRAFPSVLASSLPLMAHGPLNRVSHHLLRQIMWQGFQGADRFARKKVYGLPAAPFLGPYHSAWTQGLPTLYGFSPSVVPPPPDWDANIHVTGYWFLESADEWTPPPALLDFLEAGSPPIYLGFGSMSNRNPRETTSLIIEALKRTGRRAVLLSGWGGLQEMDLPGSLFMIDSIPHAWLFQRVAAVVHHGGAGTTAAGLRAGVPAVVVPFFGDQPFWGRRVAALGVGPRPVPRKKLTAGRLADAIQQAVTDREMRQRAAELGAVIRAEDGIARAVAIIQQLEGRGAT
jgi:UDP:flavonoid glycosyltransferase YjiC (YdhE family)